MALELWPGQAVKRLRDGKLGIITSTHSRLGSYGVMWLGAAYDVRAQPADLQPVEIIEKPK